MNQKNVNDRKLRILFLAWGYSIHAQRRIGIFASDPQYDVTIVSTYDYQIPGADTILLSSAKKNRRTFNPNGTTTGKILSPLIVIFKFFGSSPSSAGIREFLKKP